MPILSAKRQVTLPKELCDRVGVRPGVLLGIRPDKRGPLGLNRQPC